MSSPPYYQQYSDEVLMGMLRADNLAAYDVLYDRHWLRVVRWNLQKLGPQFRGDAEDLAQRVFLKVFEKRHTYVSCPDRRFLPWLYKVILSTRGDFFREAENRIRKVGDTFLEELPAPLSTQFSLAYYLSKLPSEESQILSLLIEGLSPEEVADVLSLSRATVYRKRQRAHELLAPLLRPSEPPAAAAKAANP